MSDEDRLTLRWVILDALHPLVMRYGMLSAQECATVERYWQLLKMVKHLS